MNNSITCKLCGNRFATQVKRNALGGRSLVHCPRCGEYLLGGMGELDLNNAHCKDRKHLISGLSRLLYENKADRLSVTSDILATPEAFEKEVVSRAPSSIEGKAKAVLRYIASHSENPGDTIEIVPDNDYPIGFCRTREELSFYLKYLDNKGLLQIKPSPTGKATTTPVVLTVQGWNDYLGNLDREKSSQCFVAMWFEDSVKDAFIQGIKPLEESTGFTMMRIDQAHFNEKICDRVMAEIKRSRFMIADFTNHRNAVYFEVGYAAGLGIPVIWCCRADEIDKSSFDTRQYNHIRWDNPEDLKQKLQARIDATILTQEELRARKAKPSQRTAP